MQLTARGRRWASAATLLLVLAAVVGGTVATVSWIRNDVVIAQRCTATAGGATHDLAPDQAANAATIAAVAVRRRLPARAVTIALATAIQESKLRNIDYGDRDSLGLFQQRPSQGWGTPEQVTDPLHATNAFYDALVKIDGYAGLDVTDAAQQVQRSAYGEAYAEHEPEGRVFASALTGYSPASLTCRLKPVAGDAAAVALGDTLGAELGDLGWRAAGDGRWVMVEVGAGEAGERLGWAVAHWAVAKAGNLDVVRVVLDGWQWRRDEPGRGWHEVGRGERDALPTDAADAVVVEVAS